MNKENNNMSKAERRKMQFEQRNKKSRTMIIVTTLAIIVIFIGVYFTILTGENRDTQINKPSEYTTTYQDETNVWIPLSIVTEEAKFFKYDSNGVEIRFFAVKGSDGDVRIALDACDVCYSAKKGYRQVGDDMQCINCGNRYSIDALGTENTGGGCWPSYLPMHINSDNLYVKILDLEAKRYMF